MRELMFNGANQNINTQKDEPNHKDIKVLFMLIMAIFEKIIKKYFGSLIRVAGMEKKSEINDPPT